LSCICNCTSLQFGSNRFGLVQFSLFRFTTVVWLSAKQLPAHLKVCYNSETNWWHASLLSPRCPLRPLCPYYHSHCCNWCLQLIIESGRGRQVGESKWVPPRLAICYVGEFLGAINVKSGYIICFGSPRSAAQLKADSDWEPTNP